MPSFEILCTTMYQRDFSKLIEMNIHSDIVYANQASTTCYDEIKFGYRTAKMITTAMRGVGNNRNIALLYASGDICLLADDDMVYDDNLMEIVLNEFERQKKADAIIFNVISDNSERRQIINKKCKRMTVFSRNPYGAVRIAFKLDKIKKCNIWFSTLFGGGALFPSGEDSLFIRDMIRSGIKVYISDKTIGHVKQEDSTWYSGRNEKYYYGKGAFIQASRKGISRILYPYYFAVRTRRGSTLTFFKRINAIKQGMRKYKSSTK